MRLHTLASNPGQVPVKEQPGRRRRAQHLLQRDSPAG